MENRIELSSYDHAFGTVFCKQDYWSLQTKWEPIWSFRNAYGRLTWKVRKSRRSEKKMYGNFKPNTELLLNLMHYLTLSLTLLVGAFAPGL